jgi:hypothetical protein
MVKRSGSPIAAPLPGDFDVSTLTWTRSFANVLAFALLASSVYADEPGKPAKGKSADALAVVPEDALVAIAIRNVQELTKRGDVFIEKTELKTPLRLSEGYRFVTGYLGLAKGLDEEGSAALMLFKPGLEEDSLVLAVPVKDWADMAANFKLRKEDLAGGKIVDRREREGESVFAYARYLGVRGNHLLMGGSEKIVKLAASGKSLGETLPAEDRASLAQDDILLYANPRRFTPEWDEMVHPLGRETDKLPPDERVELERLLAASKELRYALGGLRLDDGLGATLVLRFEGKKSSEILASLRSAGKSKPALSALPAGRLLAAHASSGDGDKSAALARGLVHLSLAGFALDTQQFVSAGHRPNVVGVFGEVWQRLQGSRAGLYENENAERDGHFSLVAVLDTENSAKFVTDMAGLARFVNASGLSLDDEAEVIDAKTIAELVAQLGHDEYRVRQTATTKLGLVGKAALPALEKALASTDAEVQFRTKALKQQINTSLAEEREDLLKRDLLSRIQPNFAFFPRAEKRAEQPIDIVQLRLRIDEAEQAAQLRRLLGPDWNKVRLASIDNRVILLCGSNTALFEETIGNVRSGRKGIEGDARLTKFRTRAPAERTVEFHFSLSRGQELVAAAADAKPAEAKSAGLSSLGLSISAERVRLDLFSPYDEVKSVVKKWAW